MDSVLVVLKHLYYTDNPDVLVGSVEYLGLAEGRGG